MTIASAPARWLGSLALCFVSCVGAQTPSSALPFPGSAETPGLHSSPAQRFEQAWDVVELMGQPMPGSGHRPARVLLRPQGGIWVDGGCNYFSGRIERDAQGLFRVSKYGGTHSACDKPPRSEALLNSALMMVDSYHWDRGLVLRSGGNDLVRLQPSANQDSQDIEQGLGSRAAPAPVSASAQGVVRQDCRKVKVARSAKSKARRAKAAGATRLVCKPAHAQSVQGAKLHGKSKALKGSKASRMSVKGRSAAKGKIKASGKARAKSAPRDRP